MADFSCCFQRKCPVCACAEGEYLADLNFAVFDGSGIAGKFSLAACGGCGCVFYDADLNEKDIEHYYAGNEYYATAQTSGAGGRCSFDYEQQKQIASRLRQYLGACWEAAIFDVGCGQGGLLEILKGMGYYNLYGIDLLPQAVELLQKDLSVNAACASAVKLPFHDIQPQAIVFSHVLEHALEPVVILNEAKKRLKPGGIIYVEVPDASAYEMNIPYQELYLEHLNHFDPHSLSQLLLRNGFELLKLERSSFQVSADRSLAVVYAVAKPANEQHTITEPQECYIKNEAALHLQKYLLWSHNHPAMKLLAKLAATKQKLWVWGVSQLTMLLLASSPLVNGRVIGLIDRDPYKNTKTINGLPVYSPDALAGRPDDEGVLLAVWGHEDSMRQNLTDIDFKGPVWALSFDN